jgi:hypothetical protein
MLLQTNSYIVPADKRAEHARLLRRFRQVLSRLGCDSFEVYEQVGSNWNTAELSGRVVQIMRFRDRRHQLAVQQAERSDPVAQQIIADFCQLINFPYQQQQGLFAVGFYNSVLPVAPSRPQAGEAAAEAVAETQAEAAEVPPAEDVAAAAAVEEMDAPQESIEPVEEFSDEPVAAEEVVADETEEIAPEEPPEVSADAAEAEPVMTVTAEADPGEAPQAVAESEDEPVAEPDDDVERRAGPMPDESATLESEADDLAALLDAHLDHPHDGPGAHGAVHPLDDSHHAAEEPPGLEALDLDDLDLPDEPVQPVRDPQRERRHVAQ